MGECGPAGGEEVAAPVVVGEVVAYTLDNATIAGFARVIAVRPVADGQFELDIEILEEGEA